MQELKQNNHTNYVVINDGYNVCPKCGRTAYAVMTEDQMYRVGCLHCGLWRGVATFIDEDLTDEITEAMRVCWNKKCLDTVEYTAEALESIQARNGDFIMVDAIDKEIVCVITNTEAMKQYIQEDSGAPFDVYQLMGGQLQFMGRSCFAKELLTN